MLALAAGLFLASAGPARAQPADSAAAPIRWQLVADGESAAWPVSKAYPADSAQAAGRAALASLRETGYYFARLDSARVDTNGVRPVATIYVHRGPEVRLGRLRFEGIRLFDEETLRAAFYTEAGQVLRPERLEADLDALLGRYEAAGLPLAQAFVEEVALLPNDPPRLSVTIRVEEGDSLRIRRVEVAGAERTSAAYAARVTGLSPGDPVARYDPKAVQERLDATGFFEEVGAPALRIAEDGGAVVRIPVKEVPPGAFDLAVGYLPPASEGASGRVVGNGHLTLRNLFGGGRALSLRLDRRPGETTRAVVQASDPFIAGLPLAVEGRFEGLQEDSTYGTRAYDLGLGYRLADRLYAAVTLRREVTRPGQAGGALRAGQQRIPRAEAFFAGLRLRYQDVDFPANPRRGLFVETELSSGRKARAFAAVTAEGDTTRRREALRQQRLTGTARLFRPVLRRQVAVLGAEGALLVSDAYDLSDLFRFGGATSLRGYDEDRFRGSAVARLVAEYRYQLERRSYAYLFFDLGFVRTPALSAAVSAREDWHPGYGLGLQLKTRLGLVGATYALNTEDGLTGGRIHLGLSVGL